jgi:SAM-dependent methyltransferase
MDAQRWIPPESPLDKPNTARIYDYFLGGYHNFAQDRAVAEQLLHLYPDLFLTGQANRAFLRRTVTYLLARGIDQFLDVGSGIPTMGNVHEVAQAVNPEARVVYVDIDPVAVAHAQTMLSGNERASAIRADLRQPEAILAHSEVQRLLDLERPLGLVLVAVLHYVVDDDVAVGAVGRLQHALAVGSCMVLAHPTFVEFVGKPASPEAGRAIMRQVSETARRTKDQIVGFFGDWDVVEPKLVLTPLWRPEGPDDPLLDEPERAFTLGGVACKGLDHA